MQGVTPLAVANFSCQSPTSASSSADQKQEETPHRSCDIFNKASTLVYSRKLKTSTAHVPNWSLSLSNITTSKDTPLGSAAVVDELETPHAFISKCILPRTRNHTNNAFCMGSQDAGDDNTQRVNGAISFQSNGSQTDDLVRTSSFTSVTDECVAVHASCHDDALHEDCGSSWTESLSPFSPRTLESVASSPATAIMAPVLHDFLVNNKDWSITEEQFTGHETVLGSIGNVQTLSSTPTAKDVTTKRRPVMIGSPRVVARGERKRPDAKRH